jgi:hypothetical protein
MASEYRRKLGADTGTSALIVRSGLPTILFPLKNSPAATKFVMSASVKTSSVSANNFNRAATR